MGATRAPEADESPRVALPQARPKKNAARTSSAWVAVGAGAITASGAPNRATIELWAAAWGATDVVTLQRADEGRAELADEIRDAGLAWTHAPLSGKRLAAPGDGAALDRALRTALARARRGARVVVHCSAGVHRTGLVVYGVLRLAGRDVEGALAALLRARAVTHEEVTKRDGDGVALFELAERAVARVAAEDAAVAGGVAEESTAEGAALMTKDAAAEDEGSAVKDAAEDAAATGGAAEESAAECEVVTPDATAAATARAIRALEDLRDEISRAMDADGPLPATFARALDCAVPVRPLACAGAIHGCADIRGVARWRDAPPDHEPGGARRRVADAFEPRAVRVRFARACPRCGGAEPSAPPRNEPLPPALVVATFLHELAHTVTRPEMREARDVPAAILALQPRDDAAAGGAAHGALARVDHPPAFYANFAALLRAAERVGAFALPPAADKLAPRALRRYDAVDADAAAAGLHLGRCAPWLARALGGGAPRQRRLVLASAARATKRKLLIARADLTRDGVLAEAKRLLNLRQRPCELLDGAGGALDDAAFSALSDGALVLVR